MIWKDIEGYEGLYQVSDTGLVRGVDRISPQGKHIKSAYRKLSTDKDGYSVVNLSKNGKIKMLKVHRLVAYAFVDGKSDERNQINHIDGNKQNNTAENLEWVTSRENIAHAFATGLKHGVSIQYFGENNSHCKLSDDQIKLIRDVREAYHCTYEKLAKMFGCGKTQIGRIIRGEQRTERQAT